MLKTKKSENTMTEENHTYQDFKRPVHDNYLHIKSQKLRKNRRFFDRF